jgi:hypothetical protein
MDAHERRLRTLEKAVPKRTVDFEASFKNRVSPINPGHPWLRRGVEEFVEFLPGNGKHEKRARAYLNPWCIVNFCGGGNRKSWNRALALLRQDPDFNGETHGLMGSVAFSETDGKVIRSGGLLILLGKFDRLGWREDQRKDDCPGRFNLNIRDNCIDTDESARQEPKVVFADWQKK